MTGKYDRECEAVLRATSAEVVVLAVMGGRFGHGFSVSVNEGKANPAEVTGELPELLRGIAESIERERESFAKDLAEGKTVGFSPAEESDISTEAKRAACKFCGALVIFDDAKSTVYHATPTCPLWTILAAIVDVAAGTVSKDKPS